MVETFKGTPYDTGFDQQLLAEIADYFRPIRDEALDSGLLNPKNLGVNIKTLLYQVPGGMLSNLTSQLKEQHAEDKFYDVLEEVPRVRKDLGERLWLLRLHRSLVHRLYSTFLWARDIRWLQKKQRIS